jgi:putative transposase
MSFQVMQVPGGLYHVTQRGHRGSRIFRTDVDRHDFLCLLGSAVVRYDWDLFAWCLMDNHCHILLRTNRANLSRGMAFCTGLFAQRFNLRHRLRGTPFQGKYRAFLVEDDDHFLEALRCIVLNPVKAHLVESPEMWRWSSYRITMGLAPSPRWFRAERILAKFSGSRDRYRLWVQGRLPEREPGW